MQYKVGYYFVTNKKKIIPNIEIPDGAIAITIRNGVGGGLLDDMYDYWAISWLEPVDK